MSYVVNGKKIADVFSKGKPEPLDSEFEIEDVLSAVKSMRDKIEFFEALKKERVSTIQKEIDKVKEKAEFLEDVILKTLDKVDKKTIQYPGVAKITKVLRKGKWVINDSDAVIDYLKETDQAAYDKIVNQKDVIAKKELDAVLDMWNKTDQVPDCVEKTDPITILKIKFEDIRIEEDDGYEDGEVNDSSREYDGLDF